MSLIDFILNLVALLLWVNWRCVQVAPVAAKAGISLVSTLKAAGPPRSRWVYFGLLIGLLLFRAFVYWQIGPTIPWNPCIPLGPTAIAFRSDLFGRMLVFSLFGFGASLAIFYLWLLLLSCINARLSDTDPQQRLVRMHLGPVERWPQWLKLLLPLIATMVLWYALHPVLTRMEVAPATSAWHLAGQGALIGMAVYLSLKFLVIGLLVVYLVNSYVYLGELPLWNYIDVTSRSLLRPLQGGALRVGKLDLAPVVGIGVVLVVAWGVSWGLNKIYPLLAR